jgi:hypothetical protein
MRRRTVIAALPALLAFDWFERLFAPEAELLDEHWKKSDETSDDRIDYTTWDAFLDRYLAVDGDGVHRLDYASVTDDDKFAMFAYLDSLQAVDVTALARDEQLAFWVNLYNMKTVDIILDHYPVETIRDIDFGRNFASGPWDEKVVTIEGRDLSLNNIEHGIIRPVFNEPRIHYALNCAAVGCPNLQERAFRRQDLDAMMDGAARAYVNDQRGVTFASSGKPILSSIYNWFASDFGGSEAAILDHVRQYAEPYLLARLEGQNKVGDYRYDWSLNDQRTAVQ